MRTVERIGIVSLPASVGGSSVKLIELTESSSNVSGMAPIILMNADVSIRVGVNTRRRRLQNESWMAEMRRVGSKGVRLPGGGRRAEG